MLSSIHKSETEQAFIDELDRVLAAVGFRVVDIDLKIGGRSLVRLFVDFVEKKETGVSLEDCVRLTRLIEPIVENSSFLPGAFDLEVSSPGLERRLRLITDFANNVEKKIKVKLLEKNEFGSKNLTGTLLEVNDSSIVLRWNNHHVPIKLASIVQANLELE